MARANQVCSDATEVAGRTPEQPFSHNFLQPACVHGARTGGRAGLLRLLSLALPGVLFLVTGCGSGGYAGLGIGTLSTASIVLDAGQSASVTASSSSAPAWVLGGSGCTGTACGTLAGSPGDTVTYTAPSPVSAPLHVALTASLPGTGSSKTVQVTVNPAPTLSGALAAGVVGAAYSATVSTSGGTAPVILSVSAGSLPPGLTFNATTGVIAGTPTTAGTYTVVLQAQDSSSIPETIAASRPLVIAQGGTAALVLSGNPPSGTLGMPYASALTATGGLQPYTWSVVAGSLPAGVTLGSATGVLSGTPTASGKFSFTAQVTDAAGTTATDAFAIGIGGGGTASSAPVLTTTTLPGGTVGTPYSSTIGISGGTAPYTCTVVSGTLPAGLTLDTHCVVSGMPSAAGTTSISVQATDSGNPAQSTSGTVSITISPAAGTGNPTPTPASLTVASGSLPSGTVGVPYSAPVGVSGGTAPYACALTAGTLPSGLTLGTGCVVSGTPTTAGTGAGTVQATDAGSPAQTASGQVSLTIAPATLTITTGSLPNGTVGTPYTAAIGISGGTSPYTCTLASGTLPSGLALAANCTATGTPTVAGTSSFTVKATDNSSPTQTTTGPVTVTVSAAPSLAISSPAAVGTVGSPYSDVVGVSGGTAPYTCALTAGALQAGLTLGSNCHITGTPSAAGTANITVQATDSSSPVRSTSGPVTVTVNAATPTLVLGNPAAATVGTAYSGTIPVSGGTAPYTCRINSGTLPAGLTLGTACSLTGTPTASGTATLNVTATDASTPANTTTGPVTVTVQPVPVLALSGSVPNGTVGQAYSQTLQATGGTPPYTYAVTAGTLPAGLSLSAAGVLSGTPTAPGASSFTVTATDSEGTPQTASLPLVLLITYPLTASDAEFKGPYAFLFQGYDDVTAGVLAYQTAMVGSFTADGAGVLSAGELDANHQQSSTASSTVGTQNALGTYTVGTDGRGSLTLTLLNTDGTTAATSTYALALKTPTAPGTVAVHGSFIEADNNQLIGTRGSGTLLAQTPAAFAAGLNGSYAFGTSGDTPCLPTCTLGLSAGPVAAVGAFTTDGAGAIAGGNGDANIAATNFANSTLSGRYDTSDSNGRIQLSLTQSNLPSMYPTDYAVYLVDATHAFLMSTDTHAAYILQAGSAQLQVQGTFANASMTGNYVGYENSPTNPGLVGQTLQNVLNLSTSTLFEGTASGQGTCTTNYVDVGGTTGLVNALTGLGGAAPVLQAALGSYSATGSSVCTVAASGRTVLHYAPPSVTVAGLVTATGTAPAPRVAYLFNTNQGFFLETGYAGLGVLENQTGSPYTLATLNGTYVDATVPASSLVTTNSSGVFTANGAGIAQTTLDQNVGVGTVNVIQLGTSGTSTYTLTSATAGRFLLGAHTVLYAIDPGRFVLLDLDPAVTSPSVALLY